MSDVPEIDVEVLEQPLGEGALVVDVREDDEYQAGHVAGAVHMPLTTVPDQLDDLPRRPGLLRDLRRGGPQRTGGAVPPGPGSRRHQRGRWHQGLARVGPTGGRRARSRSEHRRGTAGLSLSSTTTAASPRSSTRCATSPPTPSTPSSTGSAPTSRSWPWCSWPGRDELVLVDPARRRPGAVRRDPARAGHRGAARRRPGPRGPRAGVRHRPRPSLRHPGRGRLRRG